VMHGTPHLDLERSTRTIATRARQRPGTCLVK
jgi:hypothetical protein